MNKYVTNVVVWVKQVFLIYVNRQEIHSQSQAIAALEKQYSDQEKKSSNIQNKLENSQKLIEAKDHDITWLKASISELENKIKQQSSHLDNRYTE